ncbi:phosphodiesterase [Brucellaceae bacterium C25G]
MTRIIQLSDPHIVVEGTLCYGVVDTGLALKKAVATINRNLPLWGTVDMVIVTGDLTDFGTPEEYARFRSIMADLPLPVRVVPGNHDLRENMRAAFADQDWMPKSGGINWSADFDDFGLVCLDTLVEGHHHGELQSDAIELLAKALKSFGNKPVMIGMHHPPFSTGIIPMDVNNLRESVELSKIIDNHPAEVRLVCGHVHRSVTRQFGHAIGLIAPGTSHTVTLDQRVENPHTLSLEPGAFMMHEWREGGIVSHIIAGDYSPERHPFSTPE